MIKPAALDHIVLRTDRYQELIDEASGLLHAHVNHTRIVLGIDERVLPEGLIAGDERVEERAPQGLGVPGRGEPSAFEPTPGGPFVRGPFEERAHQPALADRCRLRRQVGQLGVDERLEGRDRFGAGLPRTRERKERDGKKS